MNAAATVFKQSFFHGTRADLMPGAEISVGFPSNFRAERPLSWVYFTATLDAAIWGAELSLGEGRERIYLVEPVGSYEDDPNVTDKRFRGNPTMSYRSREALRVIAEVSNWQGHPPERLREMKEGLERLRVEGRNHIID